MTREPWYDDDNPTRVVRGFSWRAAIWIVCAVLFFGGISIAYWGFGVGTSDVKGQGDATKKKNSGDNRIAAQQTFVKLYNSVTAADKRIDIMAAALAKQPDSIVAQTNYTGAMSFCEQAVADYDAWSDQYLSADYRPANLPAKIDATDPATDCKETAKR